MREIVIDRILHVLLCNGSGTPGIKQSFDSYRGRPVADLMWRILGGDPNTKEFKRHLSTFVITKQDLVGLNDNDLLEMFEMVVKQLYASY